MSSLSRELEFRANFIAKILQNLTWVIFFSLMLVVIFQNTTSIAGWSRSESIVLAATCFLVNAVMSGLFFSLMDIPNQIRQGTLDFVVTKPIDSQFWISTRKFNFDQLGSILAGIVMLIYGVVATGLHPDILQWTAFTVLSICGILLYYCLNLALMTTSIWFVRVDNLWVLGDTMMQIARFPLDIYKSGIRNILTFAVPIAFLAMAPTQQLTQAFSWQMVLVGIVWTAAALFLSRRFWQYAMVHYSSASS